MTTPTKGFHREEGALWLEEVRLSKLLAAGLRTPFYVYGLGELRRSWQAYASAIQGRSVEVGYAVKANHNATILRHFREMGAFAVVVSQKELEHAIRAAGFEGRSALLHGNGKRREDLEAAISAGALISADSPFDLMHIDAAARDLGVRARALLRFNPDIDPRVHPYVATGLKESKFGVPGSVLNELGPELARLHHLSLVGVHVHVGSNLRTVGPLVEAARQAVELALRLRSQGHPIELVDLGGGLGLDYEHSGEPLASPVELVDGVWPLLEGMGLRLLLEPGRSLVGSAGALIGRVIGVKHNPWKSFIVTDASMAQLIRPSLYGAYHQIELLEPAADDRPQLYDVVGPICESGDFLGLERSLGTPREGDGLAVLDAGAYGFSMASRYNLQLLCAEYLVDGDRVRLIRRAETYDDFARTSADEEVTL